MMKKYNISFIVGCTFVMLSTTVMTVDAETWGWTVAKDMCAGIINPCTSAEECTTVGFGPCEGTAVAPTAYLKQSVVGAALINKGSSSDSSYLKVCTDPNNCASMKVITATGGGFRDFSKQEGDASKGEYQYAYVMSGNAFGDLTDAGAYVGVASYVNTGTKTIETVENKVYTAGGADTKVADRVTRGDSTLGAPNGPYRVCIADTTNTNNACTTKRSFEPGAYKFSIFGYTAGTNYDTKVKSGENGFPVGMDHFGVRVKLSTVGFAVNDLKINGNAYSPDNVDVDVDKLSLCHKTGCIDIDFPKEYNIGSSTQYLTTPNDLGTVSATKKIKIRVHGADKAAQHLYIDYLFETASITKDTYFIYDPTVRERKPTPEEAAELDTGSAGVLTKVNLYLVTFAATILSMMLF
jgi:hypothetical protein